MLELKCLEEGNKRDLSNIVRKPIDHHTVGYKREVIATLLSNYGNVRKTAYELGYSSENTLSVILSGWYSQYPLLKDIVHRVRWPHFKKHKPKKFKWRIHLNNHPWMHSTESIRYIIATLFYHHGRVGPTAIDTGFKNAKSLSTNLKRWYAEYPEKEDSVGLKNIVERARAVSRSRGY